MRFSRARLGALVASAPALAVAVIAAAIHTPSYSPWRDTVSRLGSPGQPWAALVRVAFVGYGLLVLVGSRVLGQRRQLSSRFVAAVRTYAICAVIAGMAPKDLPHAPHTTTSQIHVVATLIGGAAIISAMALAAVRDESRRLRRLSAGAAVVTVAAAVAFRFTWGSRYYGAIERVLLAPAMTWLSVLAWAARAKKRRPQCTHQ
ncbi:MAG: DUF998 domain-containing protein [Actinobacteria bacterium]|nr:DUF998 domain-containing protein [Actinomycetota bacterium]